MNIKHPLYYRPYQVHHTNDLELVCPMSPVFPLDTGRLCAHPAKGMLTLCTSTSLLGGVLLLLAGTNSSRNVTGAAVSDSVTFGSQVFLSFFFFSIPIYGIPSSSSPLFRNSGWIRGNRAGTLAPPPLPHPNYVPSFLSLERFSISFRR